MTENFEKSKLEDGTIVYGYNINICINCIQFIHHRDDGPAVISEKFIDQWVYDDKNITYEVNQWLKDHNIDDWKTMSEEDKLALSFFMRSL